MTPIDLFFAVSICVILMGCIQIIRENHVFLFCLTAIEWGVGIFVFYDQLPIAGLVVVGMVWVHKMYTVQETDGIKLFALEWNKFRTHETYIAASVAVVVCVVCHTLRV